jgi:5-methylcytosine-specific restriction protein B
MAPIGNGEISLTKHYRIEDLVDELAQIQPGMTQSQAETILGGGGHAHAELADDLFILENGKIIDDTLLKACRATSPDAPILVWAALIMADPRLAEVVEQHLTTSDGKLNHSEFDADRLEAHLGNRKAATNLLRYFVTAGLVEPEKRGPTIVGIRRELPTAHAVPQLVRYVVETVEAYGVRQGPGGDPVELALALGVNHWVNLTSREFRIAAAGVVTIPRRPRGPLPPGLEELGTELSRKGQVILQGPPGVGKTYVAREYIRWATAGDPEPARITSLLASLPSHERTPSNVADHLGATGSPAAWDIVQFHPSYMYEDFVRGLEADPVPGGVTFTARNKILGFVAALAKELADRGDDAELYLIVDEINRGDISKIFGELIYALEYRGEPVATPYAVAGESTLTLPRTLGLIGTMNTADRSIAVVDYALRRRFVFVDVAPDLAVVSESGRWSGDGDRNTALAIFAAVEQLFDDPEVPELRDLQVGHSYFLLENDAGSEEDGTRMIARRFAYEVYPLLLEYETEGRFEPSRLDALLDAVGRQGHDRPRQRVLAEQVAEHFLTAAAADGDGGGDGGP